jgi:prophage regulatory protein
MIRPSAFAKRRWKPQSIRFLREQVYINHVYVATMIKPTDTHLSELWRLPKVMQHIGLRKTKIYMLIKAGEFPKPIELTKRARAWKAEEIIGWAMKRGQK